MRYLRTLFLPLVFVVLLGAGCSRVSVSSEKPKVAATIFPIYDLVRIVGGEDVDTVLILPPGASPHTYEPTPSIIKDLQGASIIFEVGHGLDSWTSSISSAVPGAVLISLDRNISLRTTAESHEYEDHENEEEVHEAHDDHGSIDPHYWLDPSNAYLMIDTIVEELSRLDPEHGENFTERADMFKRELTLKDEEWKMLMIQVSNKQLVTFHDAFMYFADHFGFTIVATFEPFPGKEPTPQYLIYLKEEVEEHQVKTLYMEPQFSNASLESFAEDNGLVIAVLDPEGSRDRTSYLEMIDYNVRTIAEKQK